MFLPEQHIRAYVYGEPVDMRRSFDGLFAMVKHQMQLDPLSGCLFAFINRRATHVKVLYWDRSGLCLWAKRLERGRFLPNWQCSSTRLLDWMQFKIMLEGLEIKTARRRYHHPAHADARQL